MKVITRIALVVIAVLLLLATFAALTATSAHAAESQFKWEHFGADPYATSREEGMRTRESAFRKLGLPADVIATFMVATDKPGEKVRIVNGDKLSAMLSKGGVVHRNVTVAFVKPPQTANMEFAAPAEKWSVTQGDKTYTVFLPDVCNNWSAILPLSSLQVIALKTPLVFKPIAGGCPDVYTLKVNVWKSDAMNLSGVAQTHAKESLEEKFVGPSHVSRTHGRQFREANAKTLLWSTTPHEFRVSFIMTPESSGGAPTITSEEIVGDVKVVGMRELRFAVAQLKQWDAIRVVPIVDGNILSPPRYSKTGLQELRYFNRLPGKKFGEWDDNPVPDCIMNEHWIEQ